MKYLAISANPGLAAGAVYACVPPVSRQRRLTLAG